MQIVSRNVIVKDHFKSQLSEWLASCNFFPLFLLNLCGNEARVTLWQILSSVIAAAAFVVLVSTTNWCAYCYVWIGVLTISDKSDMVFRFGFEMFDLLVLQLRIHWRIFWDAWENLGLIWFALSLIIVMLANLCNL